MLFTVIVPPENRSFGLSTVADWMKPVMSNGAATGSGCCAPVTINNAAIIAATTTGRPALNIRLFPIAPSSLCAIRLHLPWGRGRRDEPLLDDEHRELHARA